MQVLVLFVVLLCYRSVAATFVLVPATQLESSEVVEDTPDVVEKPYMHYFHVESDIKYRYATTLATTRIENPAQVAQEVFFTAVLPETAFISGFNMEVDGKVYEAYVKEKEEAQQIYDTAVQNGQTAAQVALTARDSNRFTVSLNVEPHKEVTFNLTYEELLSRTLSMYSDVINLDPGQVVDDFSVTVRIEESSNIVSLKVPALKVSEEMNVDNTTNALASVEWTSPNTAVVQFTPSPNQQRDVTDNGLQGQFIVQYDVDRSSNGGEVLVNDGYFVHFFAPENLTPLRKHVTFVLDLSGSMIGRPVEQLRQAMLTILDDLNDGDFFSIVLFSATAQVWDPTISDDEMDQRLGLLGGYYDGQEGFPLPAPTPSVIVKVNKNNIEKAKALVNYLQAQATTDIYDGLLLALNIAKLNPNKLQNEDENGQIPEPIIVFLTDGLPNVHVSDPNVIVSDITKANTQNSSIFSLALGTGADYDFLKKLSLQNSAFSRRIYEAADTAIQLTDFYQEISSPLLSDVQFEYTPDQVEDGTVTTSTFRRLFAGSELVVAGKLREDIDINLTGDVTAISISGSVTFTFEATIIRLPPIIVPAEQHTPSNMERLWSYLTIQQLLDQDAALDYDHNNKNNTSPQKQQALQLALEYSFVTPLTSLVVVKPNETKAVDTQDASQPTGGSGTIYYPAGSPGFVPPLTSSSSLRATSTTRYSTTTQTTSTTRPPIVPTTTAPPPATTQITPPPTPTQVCLRTLADLKWLSQADTYTLTDDDGDVLRVAGANETNMEFAACMTPTGEAGHCRHLEYCVLNTFTEKLDDFLPYLCQINSFVGACCPDTSLRQC